MADSTTAPETASATLPTDSDARPFQSDPPSSVNPHLPNPNPSAPQVPSILTPPPPPAIHASFSPAASPAPVPSAVATPAYQNHGVPPPGVVVSSAPAVGSGPPPQVPGTSAYPVMAPPYAVAGQPVRYAPPMPNGYPSMPQAVPQGAMPPPGVPHYASPYVPMLRPVYPPRLLVGVMPPLARPPVGIHGPVIPPAVRPVSAPTVPSSKAPQTTTVYVGKIPSTVENDFMLSLLQLCGPVKSWKRPQDPTGTLRGFGFCEFESADGVFRALRLLNKLSVDGQELMLNANLEKKVESSKSNKESETESSEKVEVSASGTGHEAVKSSEENLKPSTDEKKQGDNEMIKENPDAANFGLITDEDKKADHEALDKIIGMIEERLKTKPLPLPPPPPPPQKIVEEPDNSNSEWPSGSRYKESEDVGKNDLDDKIEDEKTAESKPESEHDRTEAGTPDRNRRHARSRDRDRDLRREKERELERYEREWEQERAKREKEREHRSREDERRYKVREKEWEARERERERWRKREREREKERAQERKWEVMDQEHDDDGYEKKRKYRISDEERKRRQREKEEDLADSLREEEEIAEAKIRAEEEQQKKLLEALKTTIIQPLNGHEKPGLPNETNIEYQERAEQTFDHKPSHEIIKGEGVLQNGINDEFLTSSNSVSDARQSSNLPTRKLGFGLSGSGKRAIVPSVFNEDEDAHKEKKMRPLVPIDYTIEEQQSVQTSMAEGPSPNIVAVAEFVKHIPAVNPKDEKHDIEKQRNKRSHERSSRRDRGRHEEENNSTRGESKTDNSVRERSNKLKAPENPKLLDAKQLIDTIPKTKDELFSYEMNWLIYDQNALHEILRPWISKKITDYLGEEEVTLVDYIIFSTQEHVDAAEMLERLQTILDDEAEMFVLKLWRMLIFEIKKVETGLTAPRSRA